MARVRVVHSGRQRTRLAPNSPRMAARARALPEARAGRRRGSSTLQKALKGVAPRTRAASRRLLGRLLRAGRRARARRG